MTKGKRRPKPSNSNVEKVQTHRAEFTQSLPEPTADTSPRFWPRKVLNGHSHRGMSNTPNGLATGSKEGEPLVAMLYQCLPEPAKPQPTWVEWTIQGDHVLARPFSREECDRNDYKAPSPDGTLYTLRSVKLTRQMIACWNIMVNSMWQDKGVSKNFWIDMFGIDDVWAHNTRHRFSSLLSAGLIEDAFLVAGQVCHAILQSVTDEDWVHPINFWQYDSVSEKWSLPSDQVPPDGGEYYVIVDERQNDVALASTSQHDAEVKNAFPEAPKAEEDPEPFQGRRWPRRPAQTGPWGTMGPSPINFFALEDCDMKEESGRERNRSNVPLPQGQPLLSAHMASRPPNGAPDPNQIPFIVIFPVNPDEALPHDALTQIVPSDFNGNPAEKSSILNGDLSGPGRKMIQPTKKKKKKKATKAHLSDGDAEPTEAGKSAPENDTQEQETVNSFVGEDGRTYYETSSGRVFVLNNYTGSEFEGISLQPKDGDLVITGPDGIAQGSAREMSKSQPESSLRVGASGSSPAPAKQMVVDISKDKSVDSVKSKDTGVAPNEAANTEDDNDLPNDDEYIELTHPSCNHDSKKVPDMVWAQECAFGVDDFIKQLRFWKAWYGAARFNRGVFFWIMEKEYKMRLIHPERGVLDSVNKNWIPLTEAMNADIKCSWPEPIREGPAIWADNLVSDDTEVVPGCTFERIKKDVYAVLESFLKDPQRRNPEFQRASASLQQYLNRVDFRFIEMACDVKIADMVMRQQTGRSVSVSWDGVMRIIDRLRPRPGSAEDLSHWADADLRACIYTVYVIDRLRDFTKNNTNMAAVFLTDERAKKEAPPISLDDALSALEPR